MSRRLNSSNPEVELTLYAAKDGPRIQITARNCDQDIGYISLSRKEIVRMIKDLEEAFDDGCLVEEESEHCPALWVGQAVEYSDSIENLGFGTNPIGLLKMIDSVNEGYPYKSNHQWWEYVRRLSDGAIFGPDGKAVGNGR